MVAAHDDGLVGQVDDPAGGLALVTAADLFPHDMGWSTPTATSIPTPPSTVGSAAPAKATATTTPSAAALSPAASPVAATTIPPVEKLSDHSALTMWLDLTAPPELPVTNPVTAAAEPTLF